MKIPPVGEGWVGGECDFRGEVSPKSKVKGGGVPPKNPIFTTAHRKCSPFLKFFFFFANIKCETGKGNCFGWRKITQLLNFFKHCILKIVLFWTTPTPTSKYREKNRLVESKKKKNDSNGKKCQTTKFLNKIYMHYHPFESRHHSRKKKKNLQLNSSRKNCSSIHSLFHSCEFQPMHSLLHSLVFGHEYT